MIPGLGKQRQAVGSLGSEPNLLGKLQANERLCLKRARTAHEDHHLRLIFGFHMCVYICTCTTATYVCALTCKLNYRLSPRSPRTLRVFPL